MSHRAFLLTARRTGSGVLTVARRDEPASVYKSISETDCKCHSPALSPVDSSVFASLLRILRGGAAPVSGTVHGGAKTASGLLAASSSSAFLDSTSASISIKHVSTNVVACRQQANHSPEPPVTRSSPHPGRDHFVSCCALRSSPNALKEN